MTTDNARRVPRPDAPASAISVQPSFALLNAEGWKFATVGTQAEVDFALRKLNAAWSHGFVVDLDTSEQGLTLEIRPIYAALIDDYWYACAPGDLAAKAKAERTYFGVFPTFQVARDYAGEAIQQFADSL